MVEEVGVTCRPSQTLPEREGFAPFRFALSLYHYPQSGFLPLEGWPSLKRERTLKAASRPLRVGQA